MPSYQLSNAAVRDMVGIDAYTLEAWGEKQADRYLAELRGCFDKLVRNPQLGRHAATGEIGLRRMEVAKHVVFYRQFSGWILIVRILHQSMLPARHDMESDL